MTASTTRTRYARRVAVALPAQARPKRTGAKTRLWRLTPSIRRKLLEELRAGVPMYWVAQAAGIPQRTFMDWMAKGRMEGAEEPYRSFAAEVEEAREAWAARAVKRIDAAGEKDHRALAWLLERQHPEHFGPPAQRVDATIQARPFVDPAKLTLEEQRQLYELLQKAAPAAEELPKDAAPALLALGAGEQAA